MWNKIKDGPPPLKSCGNYDAFAQIDNGLIYLQIDFLNETAERPNATFILLFRETSEWFKSQSAWPMARKTKNLKQIIEENNITGLPPGKGKDEDEIGKWFCNHVRSVRSFVLQHPSHHLVESTLWMQVPGRSLIAYSP